ncbi:unnamed protein product [Diatraea saccharalis]|uniref:CHK kinase-like domain-containing protein n=1 Tax=Diatraea saccharalis TaxID=40085 RepID=A0A9N9WI81_9NEOP|nr:unnamed protein product [Diatraea saccharalis]
MSCFESCRSELNLHATHIDGNISPTVEKSIIRIVQKEGFLDYKVDIRDISTDGGNYLANLQEIEVKGKTKSGEKEIDLFIKNKLQTESCPIPIDEAYEREAFFYNELAEIYNELQEKANVPVEERLEIAKSYKESNSDATILENLAKKGYKTWSRFEPISQQFAEISIKELAKFHALSFALQRKRPEYFESKIKTIKHLMELSSEWENYLGDVCAATASFLENEGYEKGLKVKFFSKIIENYKLLVNPPDTLSTCLCHGDFRPNNIMILEENGEIKKVIPVDYQIINYGCPVTDLIYFVFMGSDKNLRRDHLEDFKDLYYETFENFLAHFNVRAKDVYSRERFEKEYRYRIDNGLCSFLMASPFLFGTDDDIPELNNGLSKVKINFKNPACKERIRGVVDDFIQWGYL